MIAFLISAALISATTASTCGLGLLEAAPLGFDCNNGLFDVDPYPSGLINSGLPLSRVLSNKCTCEKTIVRPKFVQVLRNLPSVKRVIQNIATPVFEKQLYNTCRGLEAPCGLYESGLSNGGLFESGLYGCGYKSGLINSGLFESGLIGPECQNDDLVDVISPSFSCGSYGL